MQKDKFTEIRVRVGERSYYVLEKKAMLDRETITSIARRAINEWTETKRLEVLNAKLNGSI